MDYENYIAGLIEDRKTDRERELEGKLKKLEQKYRDECSPILKELAEIEAAKPPLPKRFG
jgi:hypothetical protein